MPAIAVLQEIVPNGLTYDIDDRRTKSERGIPLEIGYRSKWDRSWQQKWYDRGKNGNSIFDQSRVWRYREALNWLDIDTEDPYQCASHLVSLDGLENVTVGPIHLFNAARYVGLNNEKTWFLMFGNNPSESFKDGGMVALVTQGKHLHVVRYICGSTGNSAESLSQVTANERALPPGVQYLERPIIVVPRGRIAPGKLVGSIANRAKVIQVDGNFSDALVLVRMLADADATIYEANSYKPFRIEGQKAEMILTMETLGYQVPDWIVTPGGNYGSASAIHKAFTEMKESGWIDRLPRLAIVNAATANTLDAIYNQIRVRWNNGNVDRGKLDRFYRRLTDELEREKLLGNPRHTSMSAIDIPFPAEENLMKALRALDEMDGVVIKVTDEEAWRAKDEIDSNGIGRVDLASASTVAGMKKLVSSGVIEPTQVVVGRLTGRDKDPEKSFEYYSGVNRPIQVSNDFEAFREAVYSK